MWVDIVLPHHQDMWVDIFHGPLQDMWVNFIHALRQLPQWCLLLQVQLMRGDVLHPALQLLRAGFHLQEMQLVWQDLFLAGFKLHGHHFHGLEMQLMRGELPRHPLSPLQLLQTGFRLPEVQLLRRNLLLAGLELHSHAICGMEVQLLRDEIPCHGLPSFQLLRAGL
jgi:hypothetical protein